MRFQIRQNGFGLAIIEADTSMKALIAYIERQGGDILDVQRINSGKIIWHGLVYYTEPPA